MNNNNTSNDADDANTLIPIAPMYDANASNGNGGNQKVLDLTDNIYVIEYNHFGQNTRKNYVCTLTDIMVWMVDNMFGKIVGREALEISNARDMVLLSETKRKERRFLKACCKLLLEKWILLQKKSFKLEGAGCLMYNDIEEFMGTKRRIVTVNR